MPTLLLIRHASHALLGHVLAGRMPGVALSASGCDEAARLAAALGSRGIARLLSSPMQRTRETAGIIAHRIDREVEVDGRLDEIDCGAWTGATFETLAADPRRRVWDAERSTARCPDGESMAAVQERAMDLVGRLAADGGDGPVALVSHSDVIKAIVCGVLELSLDRHDHLVVDPASITTLEVWPDYGRLVRLNEAAA